MIKAMQTTRPTKAKKVKKKPAGATADASGRKRGVYTQATICQVIARTGGDTPPKSKSFKYKNAAGEKDARKQAAAWLKAN